MAIQHARVCGACDRECPSWANRCPACGSPAISFQLILSPPSATSIRKLADSALHLRRARARVGTTPEPATTLRSRA